MTLIGLILLFALNIYTIVLWARLILDWVVVLVPAFRPKGAFLVAAELVYTVTDPPLKFLRRWIKPLRVGSIALDLSWIVLFIGVTVLSTFVRMFFLR